MRRFPAALLALCIWPVLATAALAHAALLTSVPASGTVLDAMAPRVSLEFSEPVSPMAFRLLEPDGNTVGLAATAEGNGLAIELPAVEQPGTYFVEWHVVSADGHPVAGSIALSLGASSEVAQAPALADPLIRAGLWLATLLMFGGAFFGVGSAAFTAFLPREEQVRLRGPVVLLPLLAAAIGILASIPFHGAETLGAPVTQLLDAATWRASFATTYGAQAIGFGLAVLIAAIATRVGGKAGPALGVFALACLCAALLLSGHVATAEPRWLALTALVVHIAGFSFWIGALPRLFVGLAAPDRSPLVLATFSRLIVYVVAIIIASGVVLAILQLGPPSAAWLSPYGLVLLAKLGVLAVLFAVAAWNRFVLTRPTLEGDAGAARQLRTLVVVEIALVLVVLGIVGLWRFTPPPRVLAAVAVAEQPSAAPAPVRVRTHLHASGIMANFELVDGSRAVVELYPETSDADIRSVTVRLTPPVADAVPLTLDATHTNDDTWTADAPPLSDGRWSVELDIRVGDFDLAKLKGAVRVGSEGAGDAD